MPKALGCYWQVTAGVIPGMAMARYTRRFELTGDERRDEKKFYAQQAAAHDYAKAIEAPGSLNWVGTEFVWV